MSDSSNALTRMTPTRVIAGLAAGDADVKQATAADPGTALTILARSHSDGEVKLPVLASAVDTALGLIADVAVARKLLDAHVASEAQAELTAVHSDRLSVILQVADRAVVLAALEVDATDAESAAHTMFLLRAWAQNLCLRPDWEELLEEEMGDHTLRDLLLTAIWREFEGDITPDVWDGVGLNPDETQGRLEELLETGEMPRVNELDAERARKVLRDKRKDFEVATAPAALAALAEEVDDLI